MGSAEAAGVCAAEWPECHYAGARVRRLTPPPDIKRICGGTPGYGPLDPCRRRRHGPIFRHPCGEADYCGAGRAPSWPLRPTCEIHGAPSTGSGSQHEDADHERRPSVRPCGEGRRFRKSAKPQGAPRGTRRDDSGGRLRMR